jgi:hypothetical protein
MSTVEQKIAIPRASHAPFGAILFVGWLVETFFWVYATIHSAANGEVQPVITAVAAIALLILLAGMEGLEVAVIDRWRSLYPQRTTSDLAAWLAARQLFVALIVTTATLLAHRDAIVIPGGGEVTQGLVLGLFDLTWTGLTVLWFAQIFPKHMAATNPDRYLEHLRGTLFPIVEVVRRAGISYAGELAAAKVENRLDWPVPYIEEGPAAPGESLGSIWRELIPESAPGTGPGAGEITSAPPDLEQAREKTPAE